jgi:hypothetical protein
MNQHKETILNGITVSSPLLEIRSSLILFRDAGGQAEEARRWIQELRETGGLTEAQDDRALEILDLVEGFVRLDLRVW